MSSNSDQFFFYSHSPHDLKPIDNQEKWPMVDFRRVEKPLWETDAEGALVRGST
jgi:hypothetical protein